MSKRILVPLKKRIECLKNSKAYSPADAALKVTNIDKALISSLKTEQEKDMDIIPPGPGTIGSYCPGFSFEVRESLRREDKTPFESKYGNSIANTIFSLAFMLATVPDRFKNESTVPPAYYDLKMTLGDYLDALIDISFKKDGTLDTANVEKYRKLKQELSESFDLSMPLCEAIKSILEQYGEYRAELDRASHIIRCGTECSAQIRYYKQELEMREEFLENDYFYEVSEMNFREECEEEYKKDFEGSDPLQEGDETSDEEEPANITPVLFVTEEDIYADEDPDSRAEREKNRAREQLIEYDPCGYFLSVAGEMPEYKKLDFESNACGLSCLTGGSLLLTEDYSPEALKSKADAAELSPEFRSLLEETVTEESILNTFKGIDAAIDMLYRLVIDPFSLLGMYRFKRHLAFED